MSEFKFVQIVCGKVFGLEDKTSSNDKDYQTFTFSYGKKNQSGTWDNVYINITNFGDKVFEGETIKISGKFEPVIYTNKKGEVINSVKFVCFDVLEIKERKINEEIDLDEVDLDIVDFDNDNDLF